MNPIIFIHIRILYFNFAQYWYIRLGIYDIVLISFELDIIKIIFEYEFIIYDMGI